MVKSLSEDLHLDSLGRVELQSALENQLGQRLDDTAYQQIRTLGELRGLMNLPVGVGSISQDGSFAGQSLGASGSGSQ